MTVRVVRAIDAAPVPWRNGGGLTRELLAWPSPAGWLLRLSVADIASDGPFSAFPGVTRGFVVLDGVGVALAFADGPREVRPGDAPLVFDGAAAPGCRLLGGPVRDFNLMAREGRAALLPVAGAWHPPPGARAGLFARVAGTWRCADTAHAVPARTLLFTERALEDAWTFEPDTPTTLSGWWFFHEDVPA